MIKWTFLLTVALLTFVPTLLLSQQTANSVPETASTQQPSMPAHYYRLNFVLRERNDGQVLSERSYSLGVANAGAFERDWWSLRAGTKVPAGGNYVDVGINIDVRSLEVGSELQLRVKADISSLPTDAGSTNTALPTLRQMRVEEVVLVPVGKATIIFVGEDPNSKHRFELEVTPVREK
jgi:hypothetical protein